MKLAVGFITYNEQTSKYLPFFLPSLFQALSAVSGEVRVWCIDNSGLAQNENQQFIESEYHWIQYHFSGENVGFSKAYNQMIAAADSWGADYFLMINPDTRLDPQSLRLMLQAVTSGRYGAVAPRILRWDFAADGLSNVIDSDGLKIYPNHCFSDRHQGKTATSSKRELIFGASGAAALFNMTALREVSFLDEFGQLEYLDEMFFMYKEDIDLSYRLQLANWPILLEPKALVYHDRTTGYGGNLLKNAWRYFSQKKRIKSWSFYGQNLLFAKYKQLPFSFRIKLATYGHRLGRIVVAFFFSPYLLSSLSRLRRERPYIAWRRDSLKVKISPKNLEKLMFDRD